jgi:hypothetical protein
LKSRVGCDGKDARLRIGATPFLPAFGENRVNLMNDGFAGAFAHLSFALLADISHLLYSSLVHYPIDLLIPCSLLGFDLFPSGGFVVNAGSSGFLLPRFSCCIERLGQTGVIVRIEQAC